MTDNGPRLDVRSPSGSRELAVESGIDAVAISRFEEFRERSDVDLVQRVFTDDEISYCEGTSRPAEQYAGRWCVKEAVRKIVDRPGRVPFRSVSVKYAGREPVLVLDDAASSALAETIGAELDDEGVESAVSLTHDRGTDTAAAVVTVTRCA